MKSYLELVPISAKAHRKQNKMSIFCIVLAVFLVTVIFGMADMFIRSQILQTEKEYGAWHISLREISDEQAAQIASRSDVACISSYGVLNYRGDDGYILGGKDVAICGSDECLLTQMQPDTTVTGSFPKTSQQALVTENTRDAMALSIGDPITVTTADGKELTFAVSGFMSNTAKLMSEDSYGLFLSTEGFRSIYPNPEGSAPTDYNSVFFVQFSNTGNVQKIIENICQSLSISSEQVSENAQLLALLGQGSNSFTLQIYAAAAVLFILVLIAGILMIASSLNSNVAGRTQFFGMMRCIGATKKQVKKLVRREALIWCAIAIPVGVAAGIILIWGLCLVLRILSPDYFGEMPALAISWPSIAAGCVLGFLTVLLASRTPARRASMVSPLAAASGNATDLQSASKAANTKLFKIDTALGVQHARESKKNYMLMSGSFALSIMLFLSFSVTIGFMKHALNSLDPWTPDLSVSSESDDALIPVSVLDGLKANPVVKKAYGRMAASELPATVNGKTISVHLISYEENQFNWAEDYLLSGSVDRVQLETGTGMIVYDSQSIVALGDTVELDVGGQKTKIEITGTLSDSPFRAGDDGIIIICSEETLRLLTGINDYAVIDMQLDKSATDTDVAAIRNYVGSGYTFSDERLNNSSVQGSYYSFGLFIYGFLALIALVTVFNIVNSIAMSVSARTKQYGVFRAVGLSGNQLARMIISEATAYAVTGSVFGTVIGLALNYLLFSKLVSFNWGDAWSFPLSELLIILAVIVVSVILAVHRPIKRIREASIVESISAL